jgi:hypothetical protein
MLLDVGCGEDHKRPEIVTEVRVNEHGTSHAANSEVCAFGNAILGRGVRNRFLVGDAMCFAVCVHLSLDKFGGVVDSKRSDFFATVVFGSSFELCE